MRNIALRGSVLCALGLLAGLLCLSQKAEAGEVTLSVLGLEPAAGTPESVATAVTEALRQRVTSTTGYRLVPGRDLVEVKLIFSCPDEAPPCMSQAAQSIGTSKLIFGNLQPVGMDAYLVTLKLLDADRGVVEGWTSEQISKLQAVPVSLRAPAQKWFAALTGQSVPGTLKVAGGVIGASVWLDGVQVGLLGADGLSLGGVAAGPHQIVVSKTGYEKFERKVTMASGGTEKMAVELVAIGRPEQGEAATPLVPEAPMTAPPAEQEAPTGPPNQGARIAAWALLGLGLVGVGFGGYSSYEVGVVNSNLDPYRRFACSTGGAQTCSADGKKDLGDLTSDMKKYVADQQDTGDTFSKLQWVGYGVGGALIVASAVFFYRGYFNKPADKAASRSPYRLIVMPALAPNTAGARAYLSF
jgi:hypothetical protein